MVHMYVCVYTYICICTYIHTYITYVCTPIGNNIQPWQRRFSHLQQQGWTQRVLCWVTQARQKKTNTVWSHGHADSKEVNPLERKNRMRVARGWGWGKWGDTGLSLQTSSYRINKYWGSNTQHGDDITKRNCNHVRWWIC